MLARKWKFSYIVTVLERALADCREYLGPGHPMTQTVQENLDAALP